MAEIKLEKGKFYRDRLGNRVEILTTSRPGKHACDCIGMMHPSGDIDSYTISGCYYAEHKADPHDLIAEWADAPEVDWSLFSPWIVAVAMEDGGRWFEFINQPVQYESGWSSIGWARLIPPDYAPKYSGPWQQSLVVRPGKEAK